MTKSLNSLLSEADSIIESKFTKKEASQNDDIFKLAEELKNPKDLVSDDALTLTEKIAHSIAIVDTLLNLETLSKIASLEEKAKEAGYSDGQVADFFEKKAAVKFKSVLDEMSWLRG